MRIRYRRRDDGEREYDVLTQDQPRARWQEAGRVTGFGEPPAWAALSTGAPAWTDYRTTRQAAAEDMLAGRTFQSGQIEVPAEIFAPDHA